MKILSYTRTASSLTRFGYAVVFAFLFSLADHTALAQATKDELSGPINQQLRQTQNTKSLYFPLTVKRFYSSQGYRQMWLTPESGEAGRVWQAMTMLDCVLQYGLSHSDYHPAELTYDELRAIVEKPNTVSLKKKAAFDILLTDAMLTLLDHLHYGKLNPELTTKAVDAGQGDLRLDTVLSAVIKQADMVHAIEAVQPKSKAYQNLQYWMYKWKGQYTGDCYEVPEEQIRKVAINMERLRWAGIADGPYIQVNIPTFTLSIFLKDTTYRYPVIVGNKAHPTPLLAGTLTGIHAHPAATLTRSLRINEELPLVQLNLKPNLRSQLEFVFTSKYPVSMAEFNSPDWYHQAQRAVTRGNIGIANGANLAAELLKLQPGASLLPALRRGVNAGQEIKIQLKKGIPFKVTYLTCLIRNGQLETYDDVYQLDSSLEQSLYHNQPDTLVKK